MYGIQMSGILMFTFSMSGLPYLMSMVSSYLDFSRAWKDAILFMKNHEI